MSFTTQAAPVVVATPSITNIENIVTTDMEGVDYHQTKMTISYFSATGGNTLAGVQIDLNSSVTPVLTQPWYQEPFLISGNWIDPYVIPSPQNPVPLFLIGKPNSGNHYVKIRYLSNTGVWSSWSTPVKLPTIY